MSRLYHSTHYLASGHPSWLVGMFQSSCSKFLNRNSPIMLLSAILLLLTTLVACDGGGGGGSSSGSSDSSGSSGSSDSSGGNRIDAIAASCILTDARISSPTSDDDGDGLLNSIDVDDDGDGLIEITTAEQFNQIRYNLLGSNFMLSQVGVGNANGCGNRKDITACNGYELSADISLTDYDNWKPIGSCSTNTCANKNTFFKSVFDGNGHIIKDLNITNPVAPYTNAAGLFGAIDSTAQLRNVNICSSSITGAGNNVGMLVGYANGASITSSYAVGVNISGVHNVGGLVGSGLFAHITSSYAESRVVSGDSYIGGLVGSGGRATITSSYAVVRTVRGTSGVGGLVGDGGSATTTSSYAEIGTVSGDSHVGGLFGSGGGATITSSYAKIGTVSGDSHVGGLFGSGGGAIITSSYAVSEAVSGINSVGGLVGSGGSATITASYWDSSSSGITEGSYGLPKTTRELQSRINFEDIYGGWTTRCDDGSRAWNLGTSFQYPVLTCTPGGLKSQRSYTTASSSYAVAGLQAIPGDRKATLSWKNPYAQISMVSISYRISGSNNVPITTISTEIAPDANVQHTIDGLTNGKYYTFTVSLTLRGDSAGQEGTAPSIIIAIGPNYGDDSLVNFMDMDSDNDGVRDKVDAFPNDPTESTDSDNDGVGDNVEVDDDNDGEDDNVDVDDDGDGLIDIATAAQLHQVRYNLLGNSYKINATATGNENGCGGQNGITSCNGYELVVDIDLADYDNWEPIGDCPTYAVPTSTCIYNTTLFNSTFEGNGHIISNLTITNPVGMAGLFGAISSDAQLRNIHIRSASITSTDINVGILVGYARSASITNSFVSSGSVSGSNAVGGLIGFGGDARITSSYAVSGSVSGGSAVGGLVGYGQDAIITSSYAVSGSVSGGSAVGGLVGQGSHARITSSYASGGDVSGGVVLRNIRVRYANIPGRGNNVQKTIILGGVTDSGSSIGGLVGDGSGANITLSYASGGAVSGSSAVGGLVGDGSGANITLSYASGGAVSGTSRVGGLVGDGSGANITSSYASGGAVSGTSRVGGLVGDGSGANITSSYASGGAVSGTSRVGGLVGSGAPLYITSSYWDSITSGITEGSYGSAKTTRDLQSPTNFDDSIYATWKELKCDDGTQAWNLGASFQYPALICTPGKLTSQRSYATSQRSYAVIGLQVIPGDKEATISWNNPYAQIASISISYLISNSTDIPLTKSITEIAPNANVQLTIDELSNREYYTFTVSLILRGEAAGKEGTGSSIRVAIGPNYDGDGLANFVDPDDDNDGVGDSVDVFPSDPTESVDSDNDRVGDNADEDDDNDRIDDNADVDDDGDGLIDIATAKQLNRVRYNLLGNSYKINVTATGDETGCGGQNNIISCNGYELVADIDLTDYNGWEPIGSCPTYDASTCTDTAELFDSTFDGNGYIIKGLTIRNPLGVYVNAAGLFGAVSPDAQLRNIHIRSASMTGAGTNVGILVGYARGAGIANSSVSDGIVRGNGTNVGGLVGDGMGANITSSYAESRDVSGDGAVGGLVGYGRDANITSSYAESRDVSGGGAVGGLVGNGMGANIHSSYAKNRDVLGTGNDVGGLVGAGVGANVTSSYAVSRDVKGTNTVGGLVGWGVNGFITSSYAESRYVIGTNDNIGGLVGFGSEADITLSYAKSSAVVGDDDVGGLVGTGDDVRITSSYAESRYVVALKSFNEAGGLVGEGARVNIISSYARNQNVIQGQSGSTINGGGLVGNGFGTGSITASYWDSTISGIASGDYGSPRTTVQLQSPIGPTYLYTTWTTTCADGSFAWDFGIYYQYPVLTCTPGGAAAQR